jgi:hypothetical protein
VENAVEDALEKTIEMIAVLAGGIRVKPGQVWDLLERYVRREGKP